MDGTTPTVIAAALAALLALFFFLQLDRRQRQSDRAGPRWAGAWLALGFAGIAIPGADDMLGVRLLLRLLDGAFATLILAGGIAFVGRRLPRWFWGVTAALFVVEIACGLSLGRDAGAYWASFCEAPLLGLAALGVWRAARTTRAGVAEHAMAALIGSIAVLELLDSVLWERPAAVGAMIAWLTLALATGLAQVVVFGERARRRETRLREHRALLRKLALASVEPGAASDALERVARALGTDAIFPIFGIYKRSAAGTHFELAQGGGASEIPAAFREPSVDLPMLRAAEHATAPLFFEAGDERLSDPSRESGPAHGFVAPLRAAGRLVGFLGGALDHRLDDDERHLVADLADEIALLIANLELREAHESQERNLDAQRRLLRTTVDGVPVGIVMTDAAGRIALLNRSLAAQIALDDPDAWHGRPAVELFAALGDRVHAADRRALELKIETRIAASDQRPRQEGIGDFEVRLAGAEERIITVRGEPVFSADGRHLGRVTVTTDVTREREISERMQHAERMETVGTLAGGLAHDFNNQLTAILGNARLVLDKLAPGDPSCAPLLDLEHSAEHCAELTQGLLAFARQVPASRSAVSLELAIGEVESLLRPTFPPDVALRTEVAADTPPLAADAFHLQRVLVNLVANGRDAVGARGAIEVWARPAPLDPDESGRFVEIGVRDDGVGMDEATRRRVFDPFFSTKELGRGTGLGLAVVYGIVAAHGGSITVESGLGVGTTFRLRWPAAGVAAAPRPAEPPTAAARPATILVAEDEPSVRRLTRTALERAGHRVIEASDGNQAVSLHAAHQGEIDMVLLDLSMPNRGGLDALEAMRGIEPSLLAIVMSGHPDRDRSRHWPADVTVLAKPFGPRALLAEVDRVLGELLS